jgi:mannosylglycoprotein endo-beta-mannosidase
MTTEIHQKVNCKFAGLIILALFFHSSLSAQQYELNTNWKCIQASTLKSTGEQISQTNYPLTTWLDAVVPGTVLTSLLHNKRIPDPFYGMNNERIPDIYKTGRDYYTYWFVKDFTDSAKAGEKVWLHFRGVNYSCNIYLNGHKINDRPDKGMYLRQSYDITPYLAKDGHNRLAVIVYPPDPVGNPNGGQGGDGTLAHSITNQYTAGWDWIQPVRDRNTGIWDKVFIKKTKQVHIENTHVVTLVPGKRTPDGKQAPVIIKITTEVENPDSTKEIEATIQYEIAGKKSSIKVKVAPLNVELVEFPALSLDSPKLWWPNGYGPQNLYDLKVKALINGKTVSDEEQLSVGIRELKAIWNKKTNSREIRVNGQKIFIKGGNWITSDAMLRFSKDRYDAEVRYHRDMNLNLIRVWGGGITERPEFFDACDKYGLLVFQDFWVSGDCNGRWYDPLKSEDTLTRRKYPDDHNLFLESLEDQIKMLRNHASLAIWCGGNEIRPPADVLIPLRDSLLPQLDGTRCFFEFSNDDSMSLHSGDGPYTLQPDRSFFEKHSFPFNSEVGSVGIGDYESLERFIPKENLVPPKYDLATHKWKVDSVWQYHKYIGYDSAIEAYGHPKDIKDFAMKAQLVNYNQYRALMEGFSSHMWDWYTGVIIWKTQNPWTAMVGQMYDVYLDPNACLYGLRQGAKPLHAIYDPVHKTVIVVNSSPKASGKLSLVIRGYDFKGKQILATDQEIEVRPGELSTLVDIHAVIDVATKTSGLMLNLTLVDADTHLTLDENLYWLSDVKGDYSQLNKLQDADLHISAKSIGAGKVEVTLINPPGHTLAFFNRISVIDTNTYERILPLFCDNNYISVLPGETRIVKIEFTPKPGQVPMVDVEGWNVEEKFIEIKQ